MPIRIDEDEFEDSWNDKNDWDSTDNWDNTEVDDTTRWDNPDIDNDKDIEPEPTWDNTTTDWEDNTNNNWDNNTSDWEDKEPKEVIEFDEEDIMDAYSVTEGDTLWQIAENYYSDGSKYELIYMANMDVLQNPNIILPGMVLKIPYEQ